MNAEQAEAAFWAAFLRNRNVDATNALDGAMAVAGGYAVYAAGTYTRIAMAIGSARPVTDDDLAAVDAFYGARGCPPRVEVTDDVFARDARAFERFGYEPADLRLAFYETTGLPDAPEVAVRPTNDRGRWARLSACAFAEGGTPDEVSLRSADLSAAAATALFIAEIDGAPAGAGAVGIAGDIAYLYAGAVLPPFRRRGVHRALLRARVVRVRTRSRSRRDQGRRAERERPGRRARRVLADPLSAPAQPWLARPPHARASAAAQPCRCRRAEARR